LSHSNACVLCNIGNPRVTPEVTRDVCLLARMMAANLYFSQIEDLMFEVSKVFSCLILSEIWLTIVGYMLNCNLLLLNDLQVTDIFLLP